MFDTLTTDNAINLRKLFSETRKPPITCTNRTKVI